MFLDVFSFPQEYALLSVPLCGYGSDPKDHQTVAGLSQKLHDQLPGGTIGEPIFRHSH